MRRRLTLEHYIRGIEEGDRTVLARAITLVESTLPEDKEQAHTLLDNILNKTVSSVRIGITGPPGVGKSTFIEAFGKCITSLNKKLAVLSVDPSSQLTKGSILGDKTRMEELSRNPLAFIRPSASGNMLGGVTHRTRETILLCEAAGYEVIIIETVGVGQSEVAVKDMVDFFLLLMLANAGDELQGIKKGIMEMADGIAITKADGDNRKRALEAKAEYQHALHLFPPSPSGREVNVLTCSAVTNEGIKDIWNMIDDHANATRRSGYFTTNREQQRVAWFHEHLNQLIRWDFMRLQSLRETFKSLEEKVHREKLSVSAAAQQLLTAYHEAIRGTKS